MTRANLVVIRIVRGRDLDGTSSESHVDNDSVRDNGDAAVDEGVFNKLAVKMLDRTSAKRRRADIS